MKTLSPQQLSERFNVVWALFVEWKAKNLPKTDQQVSIEQVHLFLKKAIRNLIAAAWTTANPASFASYLRDFYLIECAAYVLWAKHPDEVVRNQCAEIYRLTVDRALAAIVIEVASRSRKKDYTKAFADACQSMQFVVNENLIHSGPGMTKSAVYAVIEIRESIRRAVEVSGFDFSVAGSEIEYTVPLQKKDVRRLYGLPERTFSERLRNGKIPCTEVTRQTLRLELKEYKRLTQMRDS